MLSNTYVFLCIYYSLTCTYIFVLEKLEIFISSKLVVHDLVGDPQTKPAEVFLVCPGSP